MDIIGYTVNDRRILTPFMWQWNCDPNFVSGGEVVYSQDGGIEELSANLIELFNRCSPYTRFILFWSFIIE